MRRYVHGFSAVLLTAALAVTVHAQKTTQVHPGKGGSPHVRSEWTIDGANIKIEYGRPSLKGRSVGKDVATYGQPWRTGADEATTITSDKPLKFGSLTVPAGTHTIYTLPGEKDWQLIIGKLQKPGQWGVPYPQGQDLGRVPMQLSKTAAPVEQLTISVDDTASGGTLRVEWGTVSARAPFTVG